MGADIRLVKSNELGAKKRFGQHFLRDTGVIDRIMRSIHPSSEDLFLDIGAGDGALSSRLAPMASRLLAIEIDSDRIPLLKTSLETYPTATIIPADILQLDVAEAVRPYLRSGIRLRIAGNLPYNISTAIIEKLLHTDLPIADMTFMVQLEVAQRITAAPGTREYGYFSVECQHHADVRFGFKISPACFVPRPKVVSAIVTFAPRQSSLEPEIEPDFEIITKAAFGHRRKTVENSLSRNPMLAELTHPLLKQSGIDGTRRAEQLTVREYEHLTRIYHTMRITDGK